MLKYTINTALNRKMLSAISNVICHCTATAPWLSATLMLGHFHGLKEHQSMLQMNVNSSSYFLRNFFDILSF